MGGGRGGLLWSFFLFTSGTDFHGKAALINMALKTGPFYFAHKDQCEAFKFFFHVIASGVRIKCCKQLLLLVADRSGSR